MTAPEDRAGGSGRSNEAPKSSASPSETAPEQRCCYGVLYMDSAMQAREKSPLCVGVAARAKAQGTGGMALVRADGSAVGDYKYLCVGYSVHEHKSRARARAARTASVRHGGSQVSKSDDDVVMPYCEGLEIAYSEALQRSPELLAEGEGLGPRRGRQNVSPGSMNLPETQKSPPSMTNWIRGGSFSSANASSEERRTIDWSKYPEKVLATSGKIVDKMNANVNFMAKTMRMSLETVFNELSGGKSSR